MSPNEKKKEGFQNRKCLPDFFAGGKPVQLPGGYFTSARGQGFELRTTKNKFSQQTGWE